ncbi:MAG: Fe-S cluster assembly protein HesB [Acidimicrobiia bacterium]|nr:Fe-S cluster assembly protein HesB [Acidimicrobiia bacterium]
MTGTLYITGDAEADGLLNADGTALLIGMLLDQQVPMEWAFIAPRTLRDRLGHLDASKIATMSEDDFVAVCVQKPAIHRFPGSMGKRIHAMCAVLDQQYEGRAENLWAGVVDGTELSSRVRALPGFGEEKTKIFVALLAKTQGVTPAGWQQAAGMFGDDTPRSVADSSDPDTLTKVRDWKRAQKAAKRDKQDRPITP